MKKLVSILFFFLSAFSAISQTTFPTYQPVGNSVTLWDQKGAVRGTKGLINGNYTDTTAANGAGNYIKFYPGAQIFTTSDNSTWVRDATAQIWIKITSGFNPNPTCGLVPNTGIVSYDSLLDFDVSPATYVLCCDGIPRTTTATKVTLDTNSAADPRIDVIALDATGVIVIKGTPNANPAIPQTTNCQIILTIVLINAGDNVPANIGIGQTIYDQNYTGEWPIDTSVTITFDTASTTFPVHLTKAIDVSAYTTGGYMDFKTATSIDLNDYGLLKLYIRLKGTALFRPSFTLLLDGVQQTFSVVPGTGNGFTSGIAGVYQVVVIPLSMFRILNTTTVNTLRVQLFGTQGAYIDWIQLQTGVPTPTSVTTGFTTIGVGNLDSLFNTSVTFPLGNPIVSFTKQNVPPYTVLTNTNNITGQFEWNKIDLSTPITTGLLDISRVGGGTDGYHVEWISGVAQWQPPDVFSNDTLVVLHPLRVDTSSNRDTLWLPVGSSSTTADSVLYFKRSDSSFEMRPFIGESTTAGNGLTDSSGRVILGGSLYKNTTIATVGNTLTLSTSTNSANPLVVSSTSGNAIEIATTSGNGINAIASSGGTALSGSSSGGPGVIGQSDNSYGVNGISTSSHALHGTSASGIPIYGFLFAIGTNDVLPMLTLSRASSGTAANGIGGSIYFETQTSGGVSFLSNELISKWSDAAGGTRTSQFIITGVTSAATQDWLTIGQSGYMQLRSMTATEGSAITPAAGMIIFVNNTNGTFTSAGFWGYDGSAWAKMN